MSKPEFQGKNSQIDLGVVLGAEKERIKAASLFQDCQDLVDKRPFGRQASIREMGKEMSYPSNLSVGTDYISTYFAVAEARNDNNEVEFYTFAAKNTSDINDPYIAQAKIYRDKWVPTPQNENDPELALKINAILKGIKEDKGLRDEDEDRFSEVERYERTSPIKRPQKPLRSPSTEVVRKESTAYEVSEIPQEEDPIEEMEIVPMEHKEAIVAVNPTSTEVAPVPQENKEMNRTITDTLINGRDFQGAGNKDEIRGMTPDELKFLLVLEGKDKAAVNIEDKKSKDGKGEGAVASITTVGKDKSRLILSKEMQDKSKEKKGLGKKPIFAAGLLVTSATSGAMLIGTANQMVSLGTEQVLGATSAAMPDLNAGGQEIMSGGQWWEVWKFNPKASVDKMQGSAQEARERNKDSLMQGVGTMAETGGLAVVSAMAAYGFYRGLRGKESPLVKFAKNKGLNSNERRAQDKALEGYYLEVKTGDKPTGEAKLGRTKFVVSNVEEKDRAMVKKFRDDRNRARTRKRLAVAGASALAAFGGMQMVNSVGEMNEAKAVIEKMTGDYGNYIAMKGDRDAGISIMEAQGNLRSSREYVIDSPVDILDIVKGDYPKTGEARQELENAIDHLGPVVGIKTDAGEKDQTFQIQQKLDEIKNSIPNQEQLKEVEGKKIKPGDQPLQDKVDALQNVVNDLSEDYKAEMSKLPDEVKTLILQKNEAQVQTNIDNAKKEAAEKLDRAQTTMTIASVVTVPAGLYAAGSIAKSGIKVYSNEKISRENDKLASGGKRTQELETKPKKIFRARKTK